MDQWYATWAKHVLRMRVVVELWICSHTGVVVNEAVDLWATHGLLQEIWQLNVIPRPHAAVVFHAVRGERRWAAARARQLVDGWLGSATVSTLRFETDMWAGLLQRVPSAAAQILRAMRARTT